MDIHEVPNIEFHAGVFQDHTHVPNKCNYIYTHLYAVMETEGPTLHLPFKYLPHAQNHICY
jgi:hypothetical protein